MKIIGVEATPLKTRSVIVQISTDEGISGIGECTPMNLEVLAHFVNTALQPLLIGEDPLEVDRLWNAMLFQTYNSALTASNPAQSRALTSHCGTS